MKAITKGLEPLRPLTASPIHSHSSSPDTVALPSLRYIKHAPVSTLLNRLFPVIWRLLFLDTCMSLSCTSFKALLSVPSCTRLTLPTLVKFHFPCLCLSFLHISVLTTSCLCLLTRLSVPWWYGFLSVLFIAYIPNIKTVPDTINICWNVE